MGLDCSPLRFVDMTTTPEIAQELDRQLGLNETVLRTKLLRPEA